MISSLTAVSFVPWIREFFLFPFPLPPSSPLSFSRLTTRQDPNQVLTTPVIKNSLLEIPGSIPNTLALFPQLSNLTALLTQFNLVEPVSAATGITVLAPEDSAFAAVDTSGLTDEQIVAILSQHVIVNYVGYSPLLKDGQVLNTLANGTVTVAVRDSGVYFNGAKVTAADVIVGNGVVHTVASVSLFLSPSPSLSVHGGIWLNGC